MDVALAFHHMVEVDNKNDFPWSNNEIKDNLWKFKLDRFYVSSFINNKFLKAKVKVCHSISLFDHYRILEIENFDVKVRASWFHSNPPLFKPLDAKTYHLNIGL